MKTQTIRLIDVFLLGPAMVVAGMRLASSSPILGPFIVVSGVLTIGYNGRNYLLREAGVSSEL